MNESDEQKPAREAAAREKREPARPDRELTEVELEAVAAAGAAAKKFEP